MKAVRLWQSISRIWWVGYAAALVAVVFVTVLIGLIPERATVANISMFYLTAVLAVAVAFGSGPAVLASLVAFLTFNWFFTEPYYTITVTNPDEWVALLLFLLTAMITGQLAAGQRRRAQEAEQREREAVVLYDVVRLIGEPGLDQALSAVAERLRQELRLAAVRIDIVSLATGGTVTARAEAGAPEALHLAEAGETLPSRVLGTGPAPSPSQRGAPGSWRRIVPPTPLRRAHPAARGRRYVVPVEAQNRRVGTIVLVSPTGGQTFGPADDRLLSAVAAQIGHAVERVRLRREATEAEILRRTDELKTALLNAVSHDLRTPLASIIASADSLLLQDVTWTDQERREFAQAIVEEAERLNAIVGNLLNLSRIEAGSLRPEKAWYDLRALVEGVVGRLRTMTEKHHVLLDIPEDLPAVPLDYVEIDQVLSNLIENAVKYTPPGSEIQVKVRRKGAEVEVAVADNGPGIPVGALPHLFTPFYRVDRGGPRPKGTGLGLAVARGLVEAHGGRIWVENRPGGGARFAFTLPLSEPMTAGPATVQGS